MRCPRGLFVVAALAFAASPLAGQDPWSKVPAFPTTCYNDGAYSTRLSNIRGELATEISAQESINTEIRQKSINMDMMVKQQKMMAFLQKNPAEAGPMMQGIAMAGQKSAQDVERLSSRTKAMDEQLKAAEDQYKADFAPLNEIHKKYNANMPEHGNPGNPALVRQYGEQYNAGYERFCAQWLMTPSSPLLKYLSDYKTFLVEEKVAAGLERAQWEKKEFDLYGVPSAGFKPTAAQAAVTDYLNAVHKVFDRRPAGPLTGRP